MAGLGKIASLTNASNLTPQAGRFFAKQTAQKSVQLAPLFMRSVSRQRQMLNPGPGLKWHELHTTDSLEKAMEILESGIFHSITGTGGVAPIHVNDNLEVIQLLVEFGADANLRRDDGMTPLHIHYKPEIIRFFLEKGANPNLLNWDNSSPLHTASDLNCLKLLLDFGANTDIKNDDGELPEECYGDEEMEQTIIKARKSKNAC
ncbi:MAG: hypothetical protein ACI88A_003606 [Paraglaciecola sp.]|jgi:hypothetical protein